MLLSSASASRAQTIVHRYSFNDTAGSTNFADSVGGPTWAGSLLGSAALDGSQLQLDGGGWATLPAGIVSSYSQVTIEVWATFASSNPYWTRVFAFGDQNGSGGELTGLDYCHYAGGNWQNLNFQTGAGSGYANNPGGLNGTTNVHVTVVVDPPNGTMYYFNGTTLMSTLHNTVPPLNGLHDTICLLGKSLFDVDAPLTGSLDELRVYQGVITSAALAINDAAGPNNYVANPGALLAVHLTSPDNPLTVNQSSQQIFTGDFVNLSGVNLAAYGGATFTSGNPSVLTVNSSNGLVKAIAPGTTTVSASFGGKSATNSLTVIAVPAVLAHRYSFSTDASDSVGGANGTLQGNATVTGGQLVLDGSAGTYLDLPGGLINVATNRGVTIEAWVTFGSIQQWCRLFDFGADGGSTEIYFAPSSIGYGGDYRISENYAGGQTFDWRGEWTNASLHLTCIFDPPSSTMAVYKNGVLEYARYDAGASLALISTNLAVIGRSLVAVDPYMPGSVDEFRIYSGALTPQEIAVAHKNGVNSTAHDPGALLSIKLPAMAYPAYSPIYAPTVLATFANLTNFNLLPNSSAAATGLSLTSSDPTVLQVLANNMVHTFRPGTVTLTANYFGKTDSATITVKNVATLTHRYSFTSDPSDSVGAANGVLQGSASVSGGSLILDGVPGSYLDLGAGLIDGYSDVTVDTWVSFNAAQTWARLWYFGDDRANEFYIAPSVNGGSAHWYSAGIPVGGNTITLAPQWENQALHITAIFGSGAMAYYTNGVLHGSGSPVTGQLAEVGHWFSWIGRSPYADPYLNASVDEFRVYRGKLAADEILASDVLGPNQLLSSGATLQAASAGGNIVLSWPVGAAGFSLQARSSLSGGSWTTLTNAPALVGSSWQISVPASSSPQFYRLWR
jgi:hypothetical protein